VLSNNVSWLPPSHTAQRYDVFMDNYSTDTPLQEQVSHLEETLNELLAATEKLFIENTALKEREKELLQERADWHGKNDKIRTQVESMISRLKSMDNA
jgi:cell division protein ZapB